MNNSVSQIDPACAAMMNAIDSLLSFHDTDIGEKVFFRGDGVKSEAIFNELKSVNSSIKAYLNRDKRLFYIGFIGNFSSGKSSTINSILEEVGKSAKRPTGNRPVDKCISLITNESNKLIVTPMRGGVNINIQIITIDTPLLNDLVFVDTPGTGDPSLEGAMVKDFLPVCDLILYFVSAAQPLSETDLPILRKLTTCLPFMSLYFVVTRADDYRSDYKKYLSEDNIDSNRLKSDIVDLIDRIKEQVGVEQFIRMDVENRMIIIDNISKYNISNLLDIVKNACGQDGEVCEKAHSRKIIYFNSVISKNKCELEAIVKSKLDRYKELFDNVESEVKKCTEAVSMSYTDISEKWKRQTTKIEREKNSALASAYDIVLKEYPRDIQLKDSLKEHLSYLRRVIREDILPQKINEALKIYNSECKIIIDNFCSRLKCYCTEKDIFSATMGSFDAKLDNGSLDTGLRELNLGVLRSKVDVASRVKGIFTSAELKIEEWSNSLRSRLKNPLAIQKLNSYINDSESWLFEDVSRFMNQVDMYASAVIATGKHGLIAQLGLSDEIDAINERVTEERIDSVYTEAQSKIFSGINTDCNNIKESYRTLFDEYLRDNKNVATFNSVELSDDKIVNILTMKDSDDELNNVFSLWKTKCDSIINMNLNNFKNEIEELDVARKSEIDSVKKTRKKRFLVYPAATALLFFGIAYTLQFMNNWPNTLSNFSSLIINLLSSSIIYYISYLITNRTDTSTDKISKINAKAKSDALNIFHTLSDRIKAETYDVEVDASPIEHAMLKNINNELDRLILNVVSSKVKQAYANCIATMNRLHDYEIKYKKITSFYFEKVLHFYSNHAAHADVLSAISNNIKSDAVEPSYHLLQKTHSDLEDVYNGIKTIKTI
ncbi:GTPase [Pseudodesulfovibrio sp.]|uniref:GTPase n=1 Tax=unclassified Pseudodesulfovibrio TaxID=2661612 RepID=UPI003B007A6C